VLGFPFGVIAGVFWDRIAEVGGEALFDDGENFGDGRAMGGDGNADGGALFAEGE
jgi:hypothetical protein